MVLYSDYPTARARQIIADVIALALAAVVIAVAVSVAATIRTLAAFGRDLEAAGLDVQAGLTEAADALGGVPLIGAGIRGPLDLASGAGSSIAEAGRAQQAFVELVATTAGWLVALLPLTVLAVAWLLPRIRFVVRKRRLRAVIAAGMSADTLAARALARAPLRKLVTVHPDPAAAWRSNDPALVRALAGVELRRAGIAADALP